jgi:hypothetical protein
LLIGAKHDDEQTRTSLFFFLQKYLPFGLSIFIWQVGAGMRRGQVHWSCRRYDSSVDLPYDITTEPDRVFFLKSATQLMVRGPLSQSFSLFGQGFEVPRHDCYKSPTNRIADGVLPDDLKIDSSDVCIATILDSWSSLQELALVGLGKN